MKALALIVIFVSSGAAAEHAIIPGCCHQASSISLFNPATNALAHTFELGVNVFISAITKNGAADYLILQSPTGPSALATVSLASGKLLALTNLLSDLSYSPGGLLEIASSPAAPVFYLLYSDSASVPHLICYSAELTILNQIALPPALTGQLFISPKGDRIYIATNNFLQGVAELDAKTLSLTRTLLPGSGVYFLAETSDESTLFAYLSEPGSTSASINVVNISSGQSTASIPIDGIVHGFTASSNGSQVFFNDDNSVNVVDVATGQINTYSQGLYQMSGVAGLSPSGNTLYLNLLNGFGFVEFDTTTRAFTLAVTPFAEFAQVAQSGTVILQDASAQGTVTGAVPSLTPELTFAGPTGSIAADRSTGLIYLADSGGGFVEALDPVTFQPNSLLALPPGSGALARVLATGGGYLYVGTAVSEFGGPAAVLQCDPSTLAPLATFNLPIVPPSDAPAFGNGFLSPDGARLYVQYVYSQPVTDASAAPDQQSTSQVGIAVFDTTSGQMLNNFPLPSFGNFALGPKADAGFVSWSSRTGASGVLELSLITGAVTNSLTLASGPPLQPPPIAGPLLSPDGATLWVVPGTGKLTAIDPETLTVKDSATVAGITGLLAISPHGRYLYANGASLLLVIDLTSLQVVETESLPGASPSVALIL